MRVGELLIVAAIFVLLFTPVGARYRCELSLLGWTPPAEGYGAPVEEYQSVAISPVGGWGRRGRSLEVAESSPGNYKILFSTGGCCGQWSLVRYGVVSGNSLKLNRPVREYSGQTHDQFFFIEIEGLSGLLSASDIEYFNECAGDEENCDPYAITHPVLMRGRDRQLLWDLLDARLADAPDEVSDQSP